MNSNAVPQNHHFLPRFYLRGFGVAAPRQGHQVHVYAAGTGWSKLPRSIKSVASEMNLNTFLEMDGTENVAFETYLCEMVESPAAPAVQRILAGDRSLKEDDRKKLSLLMAFAVLRSPTMMENVNRESVADKSPEERRLDEWLAAEWFKIIKKPPTSTPVETLFKEPLINSMKHKGKGIADQLYRLNWRIIETIDSKPFITSDWPVFGRKEGGVILVCFPLSSRYALLLTKGTVLDGVPLDVIVRDINVRTMEKARRLIICSERSFPGDDKLGEWPFFR